MANLHEPRFPEELRDVDSKNIEGISDLVVWAPIKQGFIDAFGNVTYASRLRIVAEALNKLRKNVREFQLLEPFADPTKRILSLYDFRIGIVERDLYGFGEKCEDDLKELRPRDYMYLTATFDGPWEPYMRQIWYPMGVFLDLVLCNCEGYVPAQNTSYEKYIKWVRDHLLDTGMFYVVTGQTVKDHFYMKELERIERETQDPHERDVKIAALTLGDPDVEAAKVRAQEPGETMTLALEALNVLYQLTRYYPPDAMRDGQGDFLLNATRVILQDLPVKELLVKAASKPLPPGCECGDDPAKVCEHCMEKKQALAILDALRDQIDWYAHDYPREDTTPPEDLPIDDSQVQKGILSSYDTTPAGPVTHGALLLIKITDAKRFRRYLHPSLWSWEGSPFAFFRNLAFTFSGLEKLSLTQKELMAFPKEFREGMQHRAAVIGDRHHNHPQRWVLPERNAIDADSADGPLPRVAIDEVDAIVQLRIADVTGLGGDGDEETFVEFEKPRSPSAASGTGNGDEAAAADKDHWISELFQIDTAFTGLPEEVRQTISDFAELVASGIKTGGQKWLIDAYIRFLKMYGGELGLELLSIQSAHRPGVSNSDNSVPTGHFGFLDGLSQPVIKELDFNNTSEIEASEPLAIKRGDLLLGFANLMGDYRTGDVNKAIQENGSFLAIRKMRQDVAAFNDFIDKYSAQYDPDRLAAKMMGRYKDGTPLIAGATDNTFDYAQDADGLQCPFASHIRRANPRDIVHKRKNPKILRRGMSYGKRYQPGEAEGEERGLMFMAYCANLAEQFEMVQRWVNGANITNIASAQFDPMLAPQSKDGKQVFKFAEPADPGDAKNTDIKVHRFERDPERPFVRLEWGAYSFVPAKNALFDIYNRLCAEQPRQNDLIDRLERGRQIVAEVERLASDKLKRRQWKILLEDHLTKDPAEHQVSSDVWEYIRKEHHGVYKIESGVEGRNEAESTQKVLLVTGKAETLKVLADHETFSVMEIGRRLTSIFTRHYIGMDPSEPEYYPESRIANGALYDYQADRAFYKAYEVSKAILDKRKKVNQTLFKAEKFKIELTREYVALALAKLCHYWFGLPEEKYFKAGGWAWDQTAGSGRLARCPGDFFSPSRGSFYPRPTQAIGDYAHNHGARLLSAVRQLTDQWQADDQVHGVITKQLFEAQKDYELLGRNIVGAMIGMLPPSEANLRGVLFDWIDEGTFWRVQGELMAITRGKPATFEQASKALLEPMMISMQKRPAPDLLHRVATRDGVLNGKSYQAGDMVILSLVSATQGDLSNGIADVDMVFGGSRKNGPENPGGNPHACPAQKMATGAMLGILTALLESGRIQALPASLILEINDWR